MSDTEQDQQQNDTTAELEAALAEVAKWKALSRKNEEQSKSNAEKAKRFDELEEQSKSELEKAIARAEAAEKWRSDREAKDSAAEMAREVAKDKGITDASVLRGSTREELEAHAEQLLSLIPQNPAVPSADGQGATGSPIGEGEMSAEDIVKAATSR